MTRVTGDWLTSASTQQVMQALEDAGHQAFFVGGCVRNALLDAPVDDLDVSTSALPDQVMDLAKEAGLKPIPTGIDHGTVTVVAEGIPFEITTFRADVETDGRRAVVAFADNIHDDAIRRDFTMNALYADRTGTITDPLGGLPDLQARRVRFIQDADRRIREDYLRILRFFRFNAWYGDPAQGWDAEALSAIASNLDGLPSLSRERVGAELHKLLRAPDPAPAVGAMAQTGVLAAILPGAVNDALAPLVHLEGMTDTGPDALRRMAVMGAFDGAALRFSKSQQKQLTLMHAALTEDLGLTELAYRHGFALARDVCLIRAASLGTPVDPQTLADARRAAQAKLPVSAGDLMPDLSGAELGKALKDIEARWIASGFTLTKAALLDSEG